MFLLFNSLDRETFSNKVFFKKAIEELQFLQDTGVKIFNEKKNFKIYFKLALFKSDNLGSHQILGFNESFNSIYFCRFCYTKKSEIHLILKEDDCILRCTSNHKKDLEENIKDKHGVVGKCIFEDLGFDVTKNKYVDLMHDCLEGTLQYDLGLILYHFISVKKFFSLYDLNNLIKGFSYGNSKNKPPEILESNVKNKRIKMSSAEMFCLIRHIILIIGHLVLADNPYFELLKQKAYIVEMIFSPFHDKNEKDLLKTKIYDYLSLLSILSPQSLRPKHHFLMHYAEILAAVGPLGKISCMREESKHREGKITSNVSSNRINVCHTIVIKNQLRMNYRFIEELSEKEQNKNDVQNNTKLENISDLPGINFIRGSLCNYINNSTSVTTTKFINFISSKIDLKSIIMLGSEQGPKFYQVQKIIVNSDNDNFLVITKYLNDIYLDEKMNTYEIFSSNFIWNVLSSNDLKGCTVTYSVRTCNGKIFIVRNWY